MAGLAFRAYGLSIGIRTNNPELIPRFKKILPFGAKAQEQSEVEILYSFLSARPFHSLRRGLKRMNVLYNSAALVGRSLDEDEILRALDGSLSAWISEFSRGPLFVHAGVVEWMGRAILIPGRTHTGKTSLVAAFLRAGARYYSDEFAVIDARGHVHPYLKPLSLRSGPGTSPTLVSAAALGASSGRKAIPAGCVLVTSYRENAHWRPRSLSNGEAALALLDNTIAARRRPKAALARLGRLAASAITLRGERGEADETARCVLERLSRIQVDSSSSPR